MATITCPYCHSQVTPIRRKKISTLGIIWIVLGFLSCFVTLFFLLFPSSWDYTTVCPSCGMKL